MAKTNNIIELNGKRYDAVTGAFIGASEQPISSNVTAGPKPKSAHRGIVVDGIVKGGTLHQAKLAPIPVKPAPPLTVLHKKDAKPRQLKPIAAHKPQHSQTLMRHVVKVPKIQPEKPLKAHVQVPTDLIKKQPAVLALKPKLSSDQVDIERADRAKHVARSHAIERFQRPNKPQVHVTAPVQQPTPHRPYAHATGLRTIDGMRSAPARPRSAATPRGTSLFEQAVAAAESHKETTPKELRKHKTKRQARKHTKLVGISAAVVTLLLLGGFIAFQNKASIELQLASSKAGFHASMPGYKPVGYAVKNLTSSPGTVTIGFRSDTQTFNVVQKASNWDSQTLLENFVATSGQQYKAYESAGRTIYVYDGGGATWVNGGVWYQVEGPAHLSTTQIVNLATSM